MVFVKGCGVKPDIPTAIPWIKEAALYDHPEAMRILAVFHDKEWGVNYAPFRAVKLYTQAAQLGDVIAQANLALILAQGKTVEKDCGGAFKWASTAAETGDARSTNLLGVLYERGCGVEANQIKATQLYQQSWGQGFPEGGYNLALNLLEGTGVEKNAAQGLSLLKQVANQGLPLAQGALGLELLFRAKPPPADPKEGLDWLNKAADGGDWMSQWVLGEMHANGERVEKDLETAEKWYRLAAHNVKDDGEPQYSLGRFLFLKEDKTRLQRLEALKWLMISSVLGYKPGKEFVADIASGYSRDDWRAAENMAMLWSFRNYRQPTPTPPEDLFILPPAIGGRVDFRYKDGRKVKILGHGAFTSYDAQGVEVKSGYVTTEAARYAKAFQILRKKEAEAPGTPRRKTIIERRKQSRTPQQAKAMIAEKWKDNDFVTLSLGEENLNGAERNRVEGPSRLRQAANKGHVPSQKALGHELLFKSEGASKRREGLEWLTKAANAGDWESQWTLGEMYAHGAFVERDLETAERWLRLAADQERSDGQPQNALAWFLLTKEENAVDRINDAEAAQWLLLSYDLGFRALVDPLDLMDELFTLEDWQKGEELRSAWKRKKGFPLPVGLQRFDSLFFDKLAQE